MEGLSPAVGGLIARCLDSVESVEILLLLRRSSDTFWTAAAVSQQLGTSRETAEAKMKALLDAGFLATGVQTDAHRYAPRGKELASAADELAAVYSEKRVSVINAIYSANLSRLRAFADAFKVKKT